MDTTLQDPLLGQALDGRYLIESRIAVGGMATVYRALDTRLDRVLAVKVMHPALATDAAFVDRFIREAKSVARLDHPNVVSVFDQGNDGSHVYLAMEYVAGCTLRDLLRERGALHPRAAFDILEPVLAALGAAHRAGLVHRDMKPENVLIGDDGRVKVADFGLVRTVGADTTSSTGSVLGTISYLAPEQIEDGVADQRSDVYACGILMYEMLTGSKPYNGGTPAQVLYQHLHEDVPPPSGVAGELAPEIDTMVLAASARDARTRPADAVEMLAAVREVRAALTPQQLDAVPPTARAADDVSDATGEDEGTQVLGRTGAVLPDETVQLNRTTRLQMPSGMIRDDDGAAPAAVAGRPSPLRSRRGLLALLLAVVVLLGGGAVIWYVGAGQFTKVPAVLAISEVKAEARLRSAGLGVHVDRAYSENVPKGDVVSSSPGPGARIRGNGTVTIVVSRGPQRIDVPKVTGMPLAQARKKLTSAGLTPGTVRRAFDDSVPSGSVVSTDPAAGTPRQTGDAIALTVSRGAPVKVPDVVGSSLTDAEQALRAAGLKVTVSSTTVYSDDAPKDSVAKESPDSGAQAGQGDTVRLTISKGQQLFKVPDVTGMDVKAARSTLEQAGFKVSVFHVFITGEVFNESPDGGSMQPKGTTVTLWAS